MIWNALRTGPSNTAASASTASASRVSASCRTSHECQHTHRQKFMKKFANHGKKHPQFKDKKKKLYCKLNEVEGKLERPLPWFSCEATCLIVRQWEGLVRPMTLIQTTVLWTARYHVYHHYCHCVYHYLCPYCYRTMIIIITIRLSLMSINVPVIVVACCNYCYQIATSFLVDYAYTDWNPNQRFVHFPECVANVLVFLWGSAGWGFVRSPQPFATVAAVHNRSHEGRMAVPMAKDLQKGSLLTSGKPRFPWQAWHFVTFVL